MEPTDIRPRLREIAEDGTASLPSRAQAGEVIDITDRGRRVARLVGVRNSRLQELLESGGLRPATRTVTELGPPLPPPAGLSASDVLAQMRADER